MTSSTVIENPLMEFLEFGPMTLHSSIDLDRFLKMASRYPDLRLEREKNGKVIIMTPVKRGSGKRESRVNFFINLWNYKTGLGEVHGPSSGFYLPDGAFKSPDCSWISDERLAQLPKNADEDFISIPPDFVVELRSSSDRLSPLKKKMTDVWMANGVRLAWLIDPYSEKVWIYREGREVEILKGFEGKKLSGEDLMPGMELPLEEMMVKK